MERLFELYLEGGVLEGRADVILDREGGAPGSLASVDYKVAEDPIRDKRYRLQLAVHTAVARGRACAFRAPPARAERRFPPQRRCQRSVGAGGASHRSPVASGDPPGRVSATAG